MKTKDEFKVGKHGIGYIYGLEKLDKDFEPVEKLPTYQTLTRSMTDAEIEKELKPGYYTLGDVAFLIENAPSICKNGKTNLFYLPSCVVNAYRHGDDWHVVAADRDDGRWIEGERVFFSATGSQTMSTKPSDSLPLELTINGHTYVRKTV